MGATNRESDRHAEAPSHRRVLGALRSSALLSLAVAGVLFVVVGYVLQTGVWAAMFAVWGAGLSAIGLTGYGLLWWHRA